MLDDQLRYLALQITDHLKGSLEDDLGCILQSSGKCGKITAEITVHNGDIKYLESTCNITTKRRINFEGLWEQLKLKWR